jgi:hypothetical protein
VGGGARLRKFERCEHAESPLNLHEVYSNLNETFSLAR